jgi:hypothetical protein
MNRWLRIVGVDAGRERSRRGDDPRLHMARGWTALLAAGLLAGCGALSSDNAVVGGETHFLITCEGGCGAALSCIDGVCTRGCEPGYSSCSELATNAACVSVPEDGPAQTGFTGTCDVSCVNDTDCAPLGAGHSCRSGMCRAEAGSSQMALSSPTSSDAPVHAVGADTCQSGLRWAGGDSASAEMHPGSDCVGCHRETDAPPLVAAGTVYATGGPRQQQPLDDCFGLEGVAVTITDAEGREYSTVTNRAGNFYFEGEESDFPLPYSASIRWTRDGDEMLTQMFSQPSYGGCARCHDGDLVPFGQRPYEPPGSVAPADEVFSTSSIFTPGLYPDLP